MPNHEQPQNPETAFRLFAAVMRKLVRVPKKEVDEKIAAAHQPRKQKAAAAR